MGRISRSFELVSQSYRLLMQDKELMLLPLLSGICSILVAGSFFVGFGILGSLGPLDSPLFFVPVFLIYVVAFAITIFFQAALIAGATERMRGGNPTVQSALATASAHAGSILMWALVAATVGMLLRMIQERVGFLGKIVVGFLGAAWSIATFFVVPVLVLEDVPVTAVVDRSVGIFKKTWGETFVGNATMSIAGFFAFLALIVLMAPIALIMPVPLTILIGIAGCIGLGVFFSALQGIYVALLYRFATQGDVPPGFDQRLLTDAFVQR